MGNALEERERKEQRSFGVVQVVVDGSPLFKPDYAADLSDRSFINYLKNSESVWKYGSAAWMDRKPEDIKLLERIAKDKRFPEFLAGVIRNGEDYFATQAASDLADMIAGSNQALEIIPSEDLRLPEKTPEDPENKDNSLDKITKSIRRLGLFLRKGMIICRGNVGEVEALRGGTLYIDGDVEKLSQPEYGIVYINGDLHHLGNSDKIILIVTGKIHEYVQPKYSAGGLGLEITPSPFIFTSEEIRGHRVGVKDHHGGTQLTHAEEFSGGLVVSPDSISGWQPQDVKRRAMDLCRKRVDTDLESIRKIAGNISDPKNMAEFYEKYILGYITARVKGNYEGASRHAISFD
ncbi:MAG: hypothetical protein HYT08_01715 [Candidatus Levybacteria bacterium]|nr:hypothetical protein [Candidatus Levybacteria bacterium]